MNIKRFSALIRIASALSMALTGNIHPALPVGAATAEVPTRLAAPAADAVAASSIALVGPTEVLPANRALTVDVLVTGATNLGAWEFDLDADQEFVDVTVMNIDPFFAQSDVCSSATRCAVPLGPWTDSGTVSIGAVTTGTQPGVNGAGRLARLTVQPKGRQGSTTLNMRNALATDINGSGQAVSGGAVTLTFGPPVPATKPVFLPAVSGGSGIRLDDSPPLARASSLLRTSTAHTTVCAPHDIFCDGFIDVRDIQPMANVIGNVSIPYNAAYDLDEDGDIDADDLALTGGSWHSSPKQLMGGPPRIGYAVNPGGDVFLRWTLPYTPYVAPVFVIYQPISPGLAISPQVIALVRPVTDMVEGLALLGPQWDVLKQMSFTTDISGVTTPATFTTLVDMHTAFALNKGNVLGANQLVNEDPGVAIVMGKGYSHEKLNWQEPFGRYWIRSRGRVVGPVIVDHRSRTVQPVPRNLVTFDAGPYISAPEGTRERANQQRFAHGTIFLDWQRPNVSYNPRWMFGYDVFRCRIDNAGDCTANLDYTRVNTEPVQPRANTPSTPNTITSTGNSNASLQFSGNEVHTFNFDFADENLPPDGRFCYTVAARDLLGQPGTRTERSCHNVPDFRGPRQPRGLRVGVNDSNGDVCDIGLTVSWKSVADAAKYEVQRSSTPSNTQGTDWDRVAVVTPTRITRDTLNSFQALGSYDFYPPTPLGGPGNTPGHVDWEINELGISLARLDGNQSISSRLVVTGATQRHANIQMDPLVVLNGAQSSNDDPQEVLRPRNNLFIVDYAVDDGAKYRYRIIPYDAKGNMGTPSSPVAGTVRPEPGQCLPNAPTFGATVTDTRVSTVNLYRKFGSGGQPILLERIPRTEWNSSSMTVTDFYSPTTEQEVSYELRAENGYGEVSVAGSVRKLLLQPTLLRVVPPAQPIINDATITKGGGKFKGTVDWVANDNASASNFILYMSKGVTEPTSYLSMTLITSGTAATFDYTKTSVYSDAAGTGNITLTQKLYRHVFDNTDYAGPPNLNGKDIFWFMVGSRSRFIINLNSNIAPKPAISSTLRPAKYVARVDEPTRDTSEFEATISSAGAITRTGLASNEYDECCYAIFRSRNGVDKWTQLSNPYAGSSSVPPSYLETDDAVTDNAYVYFFDGSMNYKMVKLDGGYRNIFGTFNMYNTTGEMFETSPVLTRTRFPSFLSAWGTIFQEAGLPTPGNYPASNLPKKIRFGAFEMDVFTSTRMIPFPQMPPVWEGEGSILLSLSVNPLNGIPIQTRVKVDFKGITTTNLDANEVVTATDIRPSGFANVMLGTVGDPCRLIDRPSRVKFTICDATLDVNGMRADQLKVIGFGPDLMPWDVTSNVGSATIRTLNNVRIKNSGLDWDKNLPGDYACGQALDSVTQLVAHTDWPIVIYPTGSFTYTERGITYSTACTTYRSSRFSDLNGGNQGLYGLAYNNNDFLLPNYTSSTASWSVGNGLTGTFNYNGVHTYSLAMPWRMQVVGNDWRFKFVNGTLDSGHIKNGNIRLYHQVSLETNAGLETFNATFGTLTMGANGAYWGAITGTNPITWATFGFTGTNNYDLYVPATLTPDLPEKTWLAGRGDAASGLDASALGVQQKTENGGVNVFKRGLTWNTCAATGGADTPVTFESSTNSGFQLYFRYGGATGKVNMPVTTGYKLVTLSGYETRISRFSQNWLDNMPQNGATLGDLFLPFPVSITLQMAGMSVNEEGCMSGGPVLPIPSKLDWWQIDVTPQAAEWRTGDAGATSVWLVGEYEVPNLTRVDGVVNGTTLDDPTIPIELSFKPNGDFGTANAYPQPTVYEINGFYSVIEEFSLSECNPKTALGVAVTNRTTQIARCDGPTGAAPWLANAAFRPAPTATNSISAYVDIVGSMVLPWFGEVIKPTDNHIYLLHRANYIGFDKRPVLKGDMSKLLPIGLELDLAFAQGKNTDGAWIGVAKFDQRDDLKVFSTTYSAVITPDNTSLVFGFPAMTAAALGAQDMECQWDLTKCGDAANEAGWQTKWDGFRNKLGIAGNAYNAEWTDAKKMAVSAASAWPTPLTAYNFLDAVNDAMCADTAACTKDEIEDWTDANASNFTNQRTSLLKFVMPDSPLQLKYIRGGTQILGVRDNTGKLISGEIGKLELDAFISVFSRQKSETDVTPDTPMFDALVSMDIDTTLNTFKIAAEGIEIKLVGRPATVDIDLEVYMGEPSGHGVHGRIEIEDFATELATVEKGSAVFGFTVKNSNLDELYLGATLDLEINTAAFGRIDVGGQFLVGRLDPSHPTLQKDYADLFEEMNISSGVIEGVYMSVYANSIPLYNIAGCVVLELKGGGGMAWWAFTRANTADTAWGVRISGFMQGKSALCLVSVAANVSLTIDNDFGNNETNLTADIFVAAGCGFCEPDEWITEAGYNDDKWCVKCGMTLGFVIPLDGSPAPYTSPEPSFSCG